MEKKHYNVVAAVIVDNDEVLCMQRGKTKFEYTSYKWEFPGGKIEQNETCKQALVREIREELDALIEVKELIDIIQVDYPDYRVSLRCYLCKLLSDKIALREASDSKWLSKDQLDSVDWLKADSILVEKLKEL